MVNDGLLPEGDTVFVVVEQAREDLAPLDVGGVAGIEPNEEGLRF
jgi:hypothetical protein